MLLSRAARYLLAGVVVCLSGCTNTESPVGGGSVGGAGEGGTGAGSTSPAGGGGAGGSTPADTQLSVLFVGNSYIYVNKLPSVVSALDEATPGITLTIDSVVKGGASLQDQWTTTGAREAIEGGHFDMVVLQGQSIEPITQPEVFQSYAALLAQAARDAGGHAAWYATWARRAGDPLYGAAPFTTPEAMTADLDAAYVLASGGIEPVAHAGRAWELALAAHPSWVLYADDGSHPSEMGTLLTALVMFRAITGVEPVVPDPPPLGVDQADADELRLIALQVSPCAEGSVWSDGACADGQ